MELFKGLKKCVSTYSCTVECHYFVSGFSFLAANYPASKDNLKFESVDNGNRS
jgi:hypothetical protein